MAGGSTRRGASILGPFLLAVIFLAALGGGVGFSLGKLSNHQHRAAADHDGAGGRRDNSTGGGNGTGDGGGAGTGGGQNSRPRCRAHTEDQAGAGRLTQLLYLRTAQSEVWICQDGNGTLYYQGHSGAPGEDLQEGVNALFLRDVQREGGNGYVATNVDPAGPITKYHVTPQRLVKEFIDYQPPRPKQTEEAIS